MTKPTEFFRWYITDPITSKRRLTTWRMTAEQAAEAYPGAVPDHRTREVRNLPETPEEVARNMHNGGRAKT